MRLGSLPEVFAPTQNMHRLIVLLGILAIASCSPDSSMAPGPEPCSEQWFQRIERELSTGDSEGHGPDLGSSEWRSVVEFKLGIREDPSVPDPETDQWCAYIDDRVS